ncbi:MAG TPA: phospho-sugar mutase [Candidatus Coprenecus stercoravium]|uniref:Phospho-sugar mutase n=1 Tax=Candidatus Coprenecus stercoravium TaxID=2840735 RepID=A0A9D2K8X5_9BACT|nr:phospho-sugar mutase [Candidatus Coprenecus stercoravium]
MNYRETAMRWTGPAYDAETREKVKALLNGDEKELEDAFYRNLEFGTGGLRGIMGVGTNRMNKYTVGMATQGFANYIAKAFPGEDVRVAVSFDSRNNSREFARITAEVFANNGFQVYLFDDIRPTPELSFAIRHYHCHAGVMVTASHNPKEYNGYKAYWQDGAQLTAPHDTAVIEEVNKISDPSMVRFGQDNAANIKMIGEETDNVYLDSVLSLMLSPESIARHRDIRLVYTPLHGTGVRLVPMALRRIGFTEIYPVAEQMVSDGNFPTVVSPNPEEHSALKMAVELARKKDADIVLATDPDADRVGVAVRDDKGEMVLLTGNQTASLLTYYILTRWQELGKLNKDTYCVKTIVTTELLKAIAGRFGVQMYDVLTGFKYIAQIVRENEGRRTFVCGGEESYGFNVGEFVRDKDAVITCSFVAECAAWAADQGLTLYGLLNRIYDEFGIYREKLVSLTKKGVDGTQQIAAMMRSYRENPPARLGESPVVKVIDYLEPEKTGLPKSNVLRFFAEDGSVVTVRPSGTEPKIKFYFGAKGDNADRTVELLVRQFSE